MNLMSISLEETRDVAKLARLDLDGAELLAFQTKLNSLLGHFQDIADLDVAGRAPKPHAVALTNVMADDIPGPCLDRDAATGASADVRAGLFIVPTIIEE